MKTIDLSHTIEEGMQIYEGDPKPKISEALTHEKDYCHVDLLELGSHTGTHIDAPFHFIKDGKRIDEFTVDIFIGKGIIIDVSHKGEKEEISLEDLNTSKQKLKGFDFIILKTLWSRHYNSEKYISHPFLAKECAEVFVDSGIKIVGIDALNIDSSVDENFHCHEVLLGSDVLIVENLCNLDLIESETGNFIFLPLKLKGSDGSPIRAVYVCDGE